MFEIIKLYHIRLLAGHRKEMKKYGTMGNFDREKSRPIVSSVIIMIYSFLIRDTCLKRRTVILSAKFMVLNGEKKFTAKIVLNKG